MPSYSIASSLSPEDPEIAFNLAAVLEACEWWTFSVLRPCLSYCQMLPTLHTGGHLEDALTHYKRSKKYGVDRAELHIRNVRFHPFFSFNDRMPLMFDVWNSQVSAKILGKRMKDAEEKSNPKWPTICWTFRIWTVVAASMHRQCLITVILSLNGTTRALAWERLERVMCCVVNLILLLFCAVSAQLPDIRMDQPLRLVSSTNS